MNHMVKINLLNWFLVSFLILAGCGGPGIDDAAQTQNLASAAANQALIDFFSSDPSNVTGLEQEIFSKINFERGRHVPAVGQSLSQLTWDQQVSNVAYDHSMDIAVQHFLEQRTITGFPNCETPHCNLQGETPLDRLNSALGVRANRRVGETIAKLQFSDVGTVALTSIAAQIVSMWMSSSTHRAILLDQGHYMSSNPIPPVFTKGGVGCVLETSFYQSIICTFNTIDQ
ncbi:MAG: CAP domain-containing protein [Deltaproteobacteria bacterium]|nr:CAP domain-containing protein [Deltaproteobacteria bacterium]